MTSGDWMSRQTESNIQTALQSQSIQAVLEKNNTTLSDGAFQSFLQNAPIPRMFLAQQTTQAIPSATVTLLVWGGSARIHDPYQMQIPASTAQIQIPIDGYYTFTCQTQFNVAGVYAGRFMQWLTVQSKRLGAAAQLAQGFFGDGSSAEEAANAGNMNMTITLPFNAGDIFTVSVVHNGGAGINTAGANFTWIGGAWLAPYNQYNQVGGAQ